MEQFKTVFLSVALMFAPLGVLSADEFNQETVKAYYAAWTNGDVDSIMARFSDDIVYADIPTEQFTFTPPEGGDVMTNSTLGAGPVE